VVKKTFIEGKKKKGPYISLVKKVYLVMPFGEKKKKKPLKTLWGGPEKSKETARCKIWWGIGTYSQGGEESASIVGKMGSGGEVIYRKGKRGGPSFGIFFLMRKEFWVGGIGRGEGLLEEERGRIFAFEQPGGGGILFEKVKQGRGEGGEGRTVAFEKRRETALVQRILLEKKVSIKKKRRGGKTFL